MNSMRNYALERTGTFADARKREEAALKFWEACKWAAARERMIRERAARPCENCWHNDSCPPSRYCPSCGVGFGQ